MRHSFFLSKSFFLFILSWSIVAWGQGAGLPWLGGGAAAGGYALLWHACEVLATKKMFFLVNFFWFSAVQAVQLSWMATPDYQGAYIYGVYAGLCVLLGISFGLISLFCFHRKRPSVGDTLLFASLWSLWEWSRLSILSGFSWNPVGMALAASPLSMQMASLGGVFFLSWWVLWVNGLAWRVLQKWRCKKRWVGWILMGLFPWLFGALHIAWHRYQESELPEYRVALLQTALNPAQKMGFGGAREEFIPPAEQWERIFTLLREIPPGSVDLIVMPESAVPFDAFAAIYPPQVFPEVYQQVFPPHLQPQYVPRRAFSNVDWAQSLADLFQAEVVIGLDHSETGRIFNAAFHFTPGEKGPQFYAKRVLVPIAEYIPFEWVKEIARRYGIVDSFMPGTVPRVFEGKVPLGISICYEETYGHLMRESRLAGAQALVNVTNDGWFPHSRLPQQHKEHARLRSVETGSPLIRCGNTGITAIFDSLGYTHAVLTPREESEAGLLYARVPLYTYSPFYLLWGNGAFLFLCLGGGIIKVILDFKKEKKYPFFLIVSRTKS